MRVPALLEMRELRLSTRLGGSLLDRDVTHVFCTELPDPGRYLSGGELVVSGLLWWRGPAEADAFVRSLAEHDAAALAASGADLGGIPEQLWHACRQHGIALLEVPPDLSFAVVTEQVVLALAAERDSTTLAPQRRLLSTVATGAGLEALLHNGAVELGAECWVRTATGRTVAGVPAAAPHTMVDVPERAPHAVLPWSLVIAADSSQWQAAEHGVAAELAGLIGLERARVEQERRVEHRAAQPLLHLLAGGSPTTAELAAQFTAAELAPHAQFRALVAASTGREVTGLVALLAELVDELGVTGPVGAVGERAYALVEAQGWPEDAATTCAELLRLAGGRAERIVLGVSAPASMHGLPGAMDEAGHAVRLGQRREGRRHVVFSEEIPVHRLLLAGTPDELRRSVRRRLLGPVLDYDAAHNTDLVDTLRAFLECSGSPATAARRLHVHVNTLRYRIGRVEDLLGLDLGEFVNRIDLYLALHAER